MYRYLRYTNLLLCVTILCCYTKPQIQWVDHALTSLLSATIAMSQLFWDNPVKHSLIHKIDAIIAKIVICTFILYTISCRYRVSYLGILVCLFVSFYFSHYHSSKEWCSTNHIVWHGIFHIFCFISSMYAFI